MSRKMQAIINSCYIIVIISVINWTTSEAYKIKEDSLTSIEESHFGSVKLNEESNIIGKNSVAHLRRNFRRKRASFAWPTDSRLVADYFLNIPTMNVYHSFMPVTLQCRFDYQLPNVNFSVPQGKSIDDRVTLYGTFESLFEHFGMDGKACVLRAICERSEYHVMVDGLLGEIISLLLEFSTGAKDIRMNEYEAAKDHGKMHGDCGDLYSSCPLSIFTWIQMSLVI